MREGVDNKIDRCGESRQVIDGYRGDSIEERSLLQQTEAVSHSFSMFHEVIQ